MNESRVIEAVAELTKEIRELRKDIDDVKRILRLGAPSPKEGSKAPPWLRFEVMESLARANKPMNSKEIAESINERRGMLGEKTSRASVSRCISELVQKHFVIQERVGRRVFYRLTGKAKMLYAEGRTLEETVQKMTEKVIEVDGRKYNNYMMSIITPYYTQCDAKKITDQIFADKYKRGEISIKASTSYKKSEISLLLIP